MESYFKLDPLTKPQGICTSGTYLLANANLIDDSMYSENKSNSRGPQHNENLHRMIMVMELCSGAS